MTTLDDLKDTLWLYTTHEQHPFQVDEAHAALGDGGDLVVDALIWGLAQDDVDMKLLVLQLLQHHYTDAERALPAVRSLISDEENRLVRVTALNTANVMGDTSTALILLLSPRLESKDSFERLIAAANLWRLCRSEDAYVVLRREATGQDDDPAVMMARSYLRETEA